MPKSTQIGNVAGISSTSIGEGDGRREKIDPNRGAGSNIGQKGGGAYGAPNAVLKAGKPSVVNGGGPSPAGPVRQPGRSK